MGELHGGFPFAAKDRQQVLLTAENDVFELNGIILNANRLTCNKFLLQRSPSSGVLHSNI
jgi:hypothetical protein